MYSVVPLSPHIIVPRLEFPAWVRSIGDPLKMLAPLGGMLTPFAVSATQSTLVNNIAGYWKLADLTDATGNSGNMTNTGSVTFGAGGIQGNCATFNGSNRLTLADNAFISTGDISFTIAAWGKGATPAAGKVLLSKGATSPFALEYTLALYETNLVQVDIWNGGTPQSRATVGQDLFMPNAWNLIIGWVDKDANTLNIQINNGKVYSATKTVTTQDTAASLSFGAYANGPSAFTGSLDEIGLWKRVLTAAERTTLFNQYAGNTYPFAAGFPTTGGVMAFEGDSLTAGFGLADLNTSMPRVVNSSLGRYESVYAGITGKDITSAITSAATNIDPYLDAARSQNICIVNLGINDLFGALANPTTIYNNLVTYCNARRAAGWNKIVIQTITAQTGETTNPDFEADRLALNTLIRDNYATFADALADCGNASVALQADNIHWSAAGAATVAGLVVTAINSL